MMQRHIHTPEENQQSALFYMERVLEQVNSGCFLLARHNYEKYRASFSVLLPPNHFDHLKEKAEQPDNWNLQKEHIFLERLQHALSFNEFKAAHDFTLEILMHHPQEAIAGPDHELSCKLNEIIAANNSAYIEPDEVAVNTFINAKILFVVERRESKNNNGMGKNGTLTGNPGFYLTDATGKRYRCFVKGTSNIQVSDTLQLKITNIPGWALAHKNNAEPIIYLEPRVMPGDIIEVVLADLSHTANSFTFRHFSYDGFLWFKRRGVNKEIFNQHTLHPQDRILARVLYTSEETNHKKNGNAVRLGIIKAIPLRWVGKEYCPEGNPDTGAARALN